MVMYWPGLPSKAADTLGDLKELSQSSQRGADASKSDSSD